MDPCKICDVLPQNLCFALDQIREKAESFMDVNLAKWLYKMERGLFAKSNYASGQACFQPFLYLRFFFTNTIYMCIYCITRTQYDLFDKG